tara:strand:- start:121 stop:408 length:288 start_codon:yes stop_codon:yes gene_type:complete
MSINSFYVLFAVITFTVVYISFVKKKWYRLHVAYLSPILVPLGVCGPIFIFEKLNGDMNAPWALIVSIFSIPFSAGGSLLAIAFSYFPIKWGGID